MNWSVWSMRLFDINNPLMRSMSKVADVIILNILFIVCSIPIITIGPSLTALHCVTMKLVRDEEGSVVKEFFRSFRLNFRQATVIHLLFLAATVILFIDIWFVLYSKTSHGAMAYILFAIAAFLAVIATMTLLYVYPVLAKFDNPTKRTLIVAFTLSIRHWPTTVILAIIAAIPIVAMTIPNEIVISFMFLMLIFGFSAVAMAQAFFLRKVFDQYIPVEQNDNISGEVHT